LITVRTNKRQLQRILRSLDKLEVAVANLQSKLPFRCAVDVSHRLRENIIKQTYIYPDYEEHYESWKMARVGDTGFWNLYGDLLRSITVFRQGSHWVAGVPPGVKDSGGKNWSGKGGKKEIGMYGWVMEFGGNYTASGGGDHPARPLFNPTLREYMKDTDGFDRRVREAMNTIRSAW
jgi:hypothetical protein